MVQKEIKNRFLKNLSLGLIYPAVLGNIFYIILYVVTNWSTYESMRDFRIKFALLMITTIFYLGDYLYTYFTYNYKQWMFLFTLVFVTFLFWTIQRIHLTTIKSETRPVADISSIIISYFVFIILYMIWDIFERRSTRDVTEIKFYNRVILWECGSAALLMVCIFIDKLTIPFITDKSLASVIGLGI
ncbi:MAG: hypothetical protein ACHQFW_05790, partial [Chitinophagales bacterium]